MVKGWRVGRRFLIGHGVLMLGLGTLLFSIGSLMTNPMHSELGYAMALASTASCLLIAAIYLGMLVSSRRQHHPAATYLMVGAGTIACWSLFWLIESAQVDVPLLVLLAGLHGLFWGLWYVRLAFHFPLRKAVWLCVLAATTSSFGIILATQSQPSRLSAVTAVACFAMFVGIQILLTAVFLNRECEAEYELLSRSISKTTELEVTEDSTVLL